MKMGEPGPGRGIPNTKALGRDRLGSFNELINGQCPWTVLHLWLVSALYLAYYNPNWSIQEYLELLWGQAEMITQRTNASLLLTSTSNLPSSSVGSCSLCFLRWVHFSFFSPSPPLNQIPHMQSCPVPVHSPHCVQNDLLKLQILGDSLAVQWLGLHASTSGGIGSIPGQATTILHVARRG